MDPYYDLEYQNAPAQNKEARPMSANRWKWFLLNGLF